RVQHLGAARHEHAPDCPLHRPAALRRRVRFFAQVWMVRPFRHGVPRGVAVVPYPRAKEIGKSRERKTFIYLLATRTRENGDTHGARVPHVVTAVARTARRR